MFPCSCRLAVLLKRCGLGGVVLRSGRLICLALVVTVLSPIAAGASAETSFEAPAKAVRELVAKRTPASRTWEMPSGQRLTQVAAGPVQWRDGQGDWHDYDLQLGEIAGGWLAHAGPTRIELPSRLDPSEEGSIRVESVDGDVLEMTLLGKPTAGVVRDGVALYRGILDGVDAWLAPMPEGLKEGLVLHTANAPRNLVYRLTLGSDKLALSETAGGGLKVERGSVEVFRIPAPTMLDDRRVASKPGRFVARKVDPGVWEVSSELDGEWLDAKERAWPVTVDPTVLVPTSFLTSATDQCIATLTKGYTPPVYGGSLECNNPSWGAVPVTSYHAPPDFYIGHYGLFRFNTLTFIADDAIDSATLKMYRNLASTGTSDIGVHRIKSPWTTPSSPSALTNSWLASFAAAPSAGLAAGAVGAVQTDLTNLVTEWRRYSQSGGAKGYQNNGFVLKSTNPPNYWDCALNPCDGGQLGASTNSDPAQRPLLEVKSWPAAPAGSAIITPEEGQLTGRRVKLQAKALALSVNTVRFQYIAGSQRTWADIPLAALSTTTRGAVASTDIPVSGPSGDRRSDMVVWNLPKMPGGDVDGPVHVRAWLDSPTAPGDGGMTDEVNFRLDRRGIEGSASVSIGPGELNLLSGEFSMKEQDVSFENFVQNLTLTRTYRSRGVAVRNADMFGSGWEAGVEADGGDLPYKGIYNYSEVKESVVERQVLNPATWNWELFSETFDFEDLDAEIETVQEIERFNYEYAVIEASDGSKMTFTQSGGSGPWDPDDLHPGFTLTRASTGTAGVFEFTLTDVAGNVARFRSEAANSPSYRLSTFKQPGSPGALSYTYEASGTRQRLKKVTGPTPSGGTERSLVLTWGTVGTPAVARVTSVAVEDGTAIPVTVATYSYDSHARLIQVTDPRIAGSVRKTVYHYNAGGQLDQLTPPGEATWNLAYGSVTGDAGPRLSSVTRAHPDGGTATSSVRYDLKLWGAGAPYNLSTTETAKWGQVDDLPWDAVGIFPEDTIPSGSPPDYSKATIYYIGLQGRTVNVAKPGGAITTFAHDGNGNVIRALTARNRATALAAGASSASVARDLSTLFEYAPNGVDQIAVREPKTQVKLSSGSTVTGRRISTTNYDEAAPSGGPYHLATSRWRAVDISTTSVPDLVDVREKVRYDYNAVGTSMSGWTARQPTKRILDPAGKAVTAYNILHPTYPVVEETREPGGAAGGNSPDVQYYQYYKIAPSARVPAAIVSSQCSTGTSYGSGRLCMRSEGTTPTASIARRWYTYSLYGHVATLNESKTLSQSGTSFRSTTNTYNGADELTTEAVSGGGGTATPTSTHTYAAASGRETQTSSSTGTITRSFDSNGRLSQYTDASGNVNTYHYDLRGRRISTTEGGTGTTTFAYDDRDNLVSLVDPDINQPITAAYNADDDLVTEALPNDLELTQTYDETGRPLKLKWTKTDDCSSDCVYVLSEVTNRDADGRITGLLTSKTQETLAYDTTGRLASSDAKRLSDDRCVRRTYTYDGGGTGDSNRTGSNIWTSSPGAACGTGSPTTRALTYDAADRISSSGWVWDEFGRATTVPAADSGGASALTAGYYSDDMMRQMVLDGRTHTYTRDALQRTKTISSTGATKPTITSTYYYADDTDEASAIGRSDGSITRDIKGPSGLVVASDASDGDIVYVLRDIQGNIVATGLTDDPPNKSTEYDPFGAVTTASPNVIDWIKGVPANGWLGAHQRATAFGQTVVAAGGPIEMGARVLLPSVGRFLQRDPVDGGALNAYDYAAQDPANMLDLDGLRSNPKWCPKSGPTPLACNNNKKPKYDVLGWIKPVIRPIQFAVNVGKCLYGMYKTATPVSCNQF